MSDHFRNTNDWYLDKDPYRLVSRDIIKFIRRRAGKKILDFGCGTGGYSAKLTHLGHDCIGADINGDYLKVAQEIGIKTALIGDSRLDFPDNFFDTTIMVEVLEHLKEPRKTLKEIKRVTKKNLLLTVPNCTQLEKLLAARVAFEHLLDRDHKNYFTFSSLKELLGQDFFSVRIKEMEAVDRNLTHSLLPLYLSAPLDILYGLGLVRPRFYFRLYAEVETHA